MNYLGDLDCMRIREEELNKPRTYFICSFLPWGAIQRGEPFLWLQALSKTDLEQQDISVGTLYKPFKINILLITTTAIKILKFYSPSFE